MNQQLIDALQLQLNKERQNGAAYDALAGCFAYMNLSGFEKFMAKNGDEERGHAKLFFDYLADIGEQPRIDALKAPAISLTGKAYMDVQSLFQVALDAETANLVALNTLGNLADEVGDQATEAFMTPILNEQVRSVREFEEYVTKFAANEINVWLAEAKLSES